jgi:uncharacterized protein (TIGR00290 family)
MSFALMSSGGKDSTLALDRARRMGLDVRYLASIYEESSGRIRFHGVRHEMIRHQAAALGLELISATSESGFEPAFTQVLTGLRDRGASGVVFGNIHLTEIREWYERRVRAHGLDHVEPLWGAPPVEIVWEVLERGYRALVVSVDVSRRAAPFLGRELDADVFTEISTIDELDPAGEQGEYHTFVFDGPELRHAVNFTRGETLFVDGHRFVDLIPAEVPPR